VRLNGRLQRKGALVNAKDEVEIIVPLESSAREPVLESKVSLDILYEDPVLLIVNKPPLLPCHPLDHNRDETTVITLLAKDYPEVYPGDFAEDDTLGARRLEGGLIHRLDNGTSGALMVARTPKALCFMREALRAGRIYRRYEALIEGSLNSAIDLTWPIAHHRKNPARMVIVDNLPLSATVSRSKKMVRVPYRGTPRDAFSHVKPVSRPSSFTLVDVIPRTGRRHQIRVHLAGIGQPIANDELYGGRRLLLLSEGRFWLHLAELRFIAPVGNQVQILAARPKDLADTLASIGVRLAPATRGTKI